MVGCLSELHASLPTVHIISEVKNLEFTLPLDWDILRLKTRDLEMIPTTCVSKNPFLRCKVTYPNYGKLH